MVLDDLKPQLQGDYSMDIYTPALHDYPFEYLINWYARQGKIMNPKKEQKILYLIIRDDSSHSYIGSGWYGDKVRSNKLLNKKEYLGSIIVEKYDVK